MGAGAWSSKRGGCPTCGDAFAIPTMSNQGYDVVLASWQGLFVPMGTLRPAVERRHRVGQAAMKNPMVVKPLSDGGVGIVTSKSPEDFTAFLKRRNDRFARAITGGKIQAEQEVVS